MDHDPAEPRLFTLKNRNGLQVAISDYGASVISLLVPDRNGVLANVVLGFDEPSRYLEPHPYFGATVGRFANRIAHARFRLDGHDYELEANDPPHHLHGGKRGFDKVFWKGSLRSGIDGSVVALAHVSEDGDEGYPGALRVSVEYSLTDDDELRISYLAETDKPTVLNLSHHSYFNLGGAGKGNILGHELQIDADFFTPVRPGLIPTGEVRSVAGTPFDFRRSTPIGSRIREADPQLALGPGGYDHNFVLRGAGTDPRRVARLLDPGSGRVMDILTTEPGLQFYSGNFLDGSVTGRGGMSYGQHAGCCLETQHFPDSPNQPAFPSTRLDPGETYRSSTIYRFSVAP